MRLPAILFLELDFKTQQALFECSMCEQMYVGKPIQSPNKLVRYCGTCWREVKAKMRKRRR